MRRLFWLGVGIAVGVVVVRKLTRTAESYTPQGIAASLQRSASEAVGSVRSFVADARAAMAEREDQIQEALYEAEDLRAGRVASRDDLQH